MPVDNNVDNEALKQYSFKALDWGNLSMETMPLQVLGLQ